MRKRKSDACRPGYCRFTAIIDKQVAAKIRAEAIHRGVLLADLVNGILDQWVTRHGQADSDTNNNN